MRTDSEWMALAIEVAKKAWGLTHPNPMVGAVIVENGKAVAEGYHLRAGEAHAERVAFRELGRRPLESATLYVTLEPCSSHGRTPPCVDAILEAGIRRVVMGARDPDPRHRGRGAEWLRAKGVEVVEGVLEPQCEDLNLIFHHRMLTGRPLVAAKVATTLDGRIATRSGQSKWITGPEARRDAMRWRRYFPAVGVGAGTVVADDPVLTSRIPGVEPEVVVPRRFLFDRKGSLAQFFGQRAVLKPNAAGVVWITSPEAAKEVRSRWAGSGPAIWPVAVGPVRDWWPDFLGRMEGASLGGVWIEGGSGLLGELFAAGGIDYLFQYRAPKALLDPSAKTFADAGPLGELEDAWTLDRIQRSVLGADDLIRGWVRRRR